MVEGPAGDPSPAMLAGLRAHVEQMREGFGPPATRGSFGLTALERWIDVIADDAPHGASLAAQIEGRGGGPAMRLAQATFLDEAGLPEAATATRAAAERWTALALALRTGDARPAHVRSVQEAEAAALDAAALAFGMPSA